MWGKLVEFEEEVGESVATVWEEWEISGRNM